jgi:hypothetical protein
MIYIIHLRVARVWRLMPLGIILIITRYSGFVIGDNTRYSGYDNIMKNNLKMY